MGTMIEQVCSSPERARKFGGAAAQSVPPDRDQRTRVLRGPRLLGGLHARTVRKASAGPALARGQMASLGAPITDDMRCAPSGLGVRPRWGILVPAVPHRVD